MLSTEDCEHTVDRDPVVDEASLAKRRRSLVKARNAFAKAREARCASREAAAGGKGPFDPRSERAYCIARHYLMIAVRAVESGDPSALARKAEYMSIAQLPADVGVDDVLYYREKRKVHLFYGGKPSPPGEDTAPDGRGHGHVVLLRRNSVYRVVYSRPPKGE